MVVTTLQKLIGLSVAMLGQAPGTDLLNEWTRLYTRSREHGMDAMAALQQVAQHILDSAAFAEVHPPYTIIENQDFAQRFLDQVLGETASAEMVTLVVVLLDGGTSRAEVAVRAVEYLLEVNHQGSDHADFATFGTYATRFGNQVEVARYYTVDKKWMTPGESVLNEVDDTAASVTAAKGDIDGMQQPGKNFTLTTGVDQFTGTPGDDTFVATESTLNGGDRLNGKGGMDTLELSSGSGTNADISIPRGATVKDIETLSVTSDGDFRGDVSKWTGLETVKLEVVKDVDLELKVGGGTEVTSTSLGDDDDASKITIKNAGMVKLEGVSTKAEVVIEGEDTASVMVEGAKSVKVDSDSVASVMFEGLAGDELSDATGPLTSSRSITVDGVLNPNFISRHEAIIHADMIEKLGVANTGPAHILIRDEVGAGGKLTLALDNFNKAAGVTRFPTVVLDGKGQAEHVLIEAAAGSANYLGLSATGMLKRVDVSGEGALDLVAQNANEGKDGVFLPSSTVEELTLSGSGKFTMDAKGMSKLKEVDAGDASGAVKIDNLGKSVTEYTGSMGKDTVSVAAFNAKGLMADLGAGDDTFTVDNLAAGKSKINGGAGMDTLLLKQKVGADLKGARDAYSGFEKITLDASGGMGDYDLKGLDIDELKIGASVGAAGGVKFKNVAPGTGLSVSSAAERNTVAIVNYMLESGQGSRFGDRDSALDLDLHAMGHANDDAATQVKSGLRGVLMHLTLDDDIDTLVVDAGATSLNKVKASDYIHYIGFKGADKIEQIKITGNARIEFSNRHYFEYKTDAKDWYDLAKGSSGSDANALTALEYVDARENTGGLGIILNSAAEVHGSQGSDRIRGAWDGSNKATNHKDKLMGHGGDDFIAGGSGPDEIAGGAGGDILTGGPYILNTGTTTVGGVSGVFASPLIGSPAGSRFSKSQTGDKAEDKFIYTEASDSQVDLSDTSGGFDVIVRFEAAHDKIDLSKVVDLRGTINTISNGGKVPLKTLLDNEVGDGMFESESSSSSFSKQKHSIALVDTIENGFVEYMGRHSNNDKELFDGTRNGVDVKWVLVDVDGDGDFDANTDMAIALVDIDGTISTSSTGIFI